MRLVSKYEIQQTRFIDKNIILVFNEIVLFNYYTGNKTNFSC